jgi:myo-inositol-1(or 4)-monophosphatase
MKGLQQLCDDTLELVNDTGLFIQGEASSFSSDKIETKGLHDFVSYVDKEAEVKLVDGLGKILPEAGFITEENTVSDRKDLTWVVDPLDGTTNFIHGVPCYSISIGLLDGDEVIMGIIHEINLKESFWAWKGGPAFLNGKEIYVSPVTSLENALLVTGFPNRDYSRLDEYMDLFKHFMETTHGLRRFGSAAVDLAYVACGRCEGFYEYGLSAWDVAAGALIVQRAGGRVTDFNGGDNYLFGEEIIAAGAPIFSEFFSEINLFLAK